MTDPSVGSSSPNWASLISNGIVPAFSKPPSNYLSNITCHKFFRQAVSELSANNVQVTEARGPSKEATRDLPLLRSGLSGQMSPYAPVFHPMGSYASHLLALEQAAQVNPPSLPPLPPRPMDPHLEDFYDRAEVFHCDESHQIQAHMHPSEFCESGCTVDLTIRVSPNSRISAQTQRPRGNWHEPLNREFWPEGDQQGVPVQRVIHPQMHIQIPHIAGQMPAHVPGQMSGQMPVQMPVKMPVQMPAQIPVQSSVQIPPQVLIKVQQTAQPPDCWRELEKPIVGQRGPVYHMGSTVEQQLLPPVSEAEIQLSAEEKQGKSNDIWRANEQANFIETKQGLEGWSNMDRTQPEFFLQGQGHPASVHLDYWPEMEHHSSSKTEPMPRQFGEIPSDFWQDTHTALPNHQCWGGIREAEQLISTGEPAQKRAQQLLQQGQWQQRQQLHEQQQQQQQLQRHQQQHIQLQQEDHSSNVQILPRELWREIEMSGSSTASHTQPPSQPASYDYWRDIEQLIAAFSTQPSQTQGGSQSWQSIEEQPRDFASEANQVAPPLAETQLQERPFAMWWSRDEEHLPPGATEPVDQDHCSPDTAGEIDNTDRDWWAPSELPEIVPQQQEWYLSQQQKPIALALSAQSQSGQSSKCNYWNDEKTVNADERQDVPSECWLDQEERKSVVEDTDQEPPVVHTETEKQSRMITSLPPSPPPPPPPPHSPPAPAATADSQQPQLMAPAPASQPREWWQAAAFTPQEQTYIVEPVQPIQPLQPVKTGKPVQQVQPVQPRSMESDVDWVPYSYASLSLLSMPTSGIISAEKDVDPALDERNSERNTSTVLPKVRNSALGSNGCEGPGADFPSFEDFARQVSECSLSSSEYIATLRNLMIRAHNLMLPLLRGRFANMTQVQMAAYTTAILEVTPLHPSLFLPSSVARPWMGNGGLLPPCHPHSLTPQDLARINPRPRLVNVGTQTDYHCWCMHISMYPPPPLHAPPAPPPQPQRPQGNPAAHFSAPNGPRMMAPCATAPLSFWGRPIVPMHPHPYTHAHQMPRPHGSRYGYRINTYSVPCRFGPAGNGRARHVSNVYGASMHPPGQQSEDNAFSDRGFNYYTEQPSQPGHPLQQQQQQPKQQQQQHQQQQQQQYRQLQQHPHEQQQMIHPPPFGIPTSNVTGSSNHNSHMQRLHQLHQQQQQQIQQQQQMQNQQISHRHPNLQHEPPQHQSGSSSVSQSSSPVLRTEHQSRPCLASSSSASQSSSLSPPSSTHSSSLMSNNETDGEDDNDPSNNVSSNAHGNENDNEIAVVDSAKDTRSNGKSNCIRNFSTSIGQPAAVATIQQPLTQEDEDNDRHAIGSDSNLAPPPALTQDMGNADTLSANRMVMKQMNNIFLQPTGPVMPSMPMMHFIMAQSGGQGEIPPLIFDMNDNYSPNINYAQFLPNINMNMNVNMFSSPMGSPVSNVHVISGDMTGNFCQLVPDMAMMNTAMILPYSTYKSSSDPFTTIEVNENFDATNATIMTIPLEEINPILSSNVYMGNEMLVTATNEANMSDCSNNEGYSNGDTCKESNLFNGSELNNQQ